MKTLKTLMAAMLCATLLFSGCDKEKDIDPYEGIIYDNQGANYNDLFTPEYWNEKPIGYKVSPVEMQELIKAAPSISFDKLSGIL